ncbi:MAG: DUF4278 domain-containing protein [Nostoc sp. ZfuVER08]|jgi:hypothetical protein|uniref:DUF4278 domain-containing protein n=1 Tax=Nostoc punctiforme FACHB-252 TaxID=1357509 RepID=A0ABR8H2S2_NOSPU|nr:DUF4278 domain-containing protein [Nostoc punctiforme]MBD2610095.1 DUF4278 domain-containing protein [Nostoc punctiforme FACHB-252]MBL1197760.1 DUF4278 domain-containing protein [Nostoc sp. GBBB01]MDZ8015980.1 DUF4278 domain-containing protein [Nostoc sp. ZfuVER08]
MKLHYRGLSYEYNPRQVGSKKTQQALTSGHNLTYRGVSYLVESNSTFNEVPQAPLAYKLSFRGSGYFVNKTA